MFKVRMKYPYGGAAKLESVFTNLFLVAVLIIVKDHQLKNMCFQATSFLQLFLILEHSISTQYI